MGVVQVGVVLARYLSEFNDDFNGWDRKAG